MRFFGFQFLKPILQPFTHLIQSWNTIHGFRDQFWSVKCPIVWYAKTSSSSIPSHQALPAITMNTVDENKPHQNALYLFKFYSISIILFLKKQLNQRDIICEINKIGMNLWMVYIWNMKSSEKYNMKKYEEGECTSHCRLKSSEICDCSRPFQEF